MKRYGLALAVGAVVIVLIGWRLGASVFSDAVEPSATESPMLDDFGALPAFSLLDAGGQPFGDQDLKGTVYIANTFFCSCVTICPFMMKQVASVQKRLEDAGSSLRLVSITVDPENDTPEVLSKYGEELQVDPSRWILLTGELAVIHHLVVRGFRTAMGEPVVSDDGSYDITHSGKLFLVDGEGHVRGFWGVQDTDLDALVDAARGLAGER